MHDELFTILGPGDALPETGQSAMLVDDQVYPAAEFDRLAPRVELGDCVERVAEGYRLKADAVALLDKIKKVDGHVLFFATDDTHVNTMLRIAPHCRRYTFVVHATLDFGSRAALERNRQEYTVHRRSMDAFRTADFALIGNDNGKEERLFIHHCRQFNIPMASLQEAVNMDFEGAPYRMQWAERTFVGGVHALRYHHRVFSVITGNPRYDDIRPKPLPENPYVLINCNFTYGIAEGWSRAWLDQTIDAAKRAGVEYRITVHPRDETDLTGVKNILDSNAFVVHEQIAGCYVLVSRDSSVPYEALLMNRHVVYYNPFHETERCLNEDDTGLINKAEDVETLAGLLSELREKTLPLDDAGGLAETFQAYFTGIDGKNHLRVVRALHVMIDGNYYGRPDARHDSYFVAWTHVMLQNVLRPKLRKITVLRTVWKFFKYQVFRFPPE